MGHAAREKSTIVQHLAQMLVAGGETVHVTAGPSNGPIGTLARELIETVAERAEHARPRPLEDYAKP